MIGADTNVLIRYFVQDDPEQSAAATKYIEDYCSKGDVIFINHIVMCEIVWVLQRCYHLNKAAIGQVIEQILRTAQFKIQSPTIIWQALKDYKAGDADFADYLICRTNMANECSVTITFDKNAGKSNCFHLLI